MKRQLCYPCLIRLEEAGKHNIKHIEGGKNQKITCYKCKRRRFGAVYDVTRKGIIN